ncbi:MAG: hypothetical protein ACYC3X_29065 [Pirellulaceae bacterium]
MSHVIRLREPWNVSSDANGRLELRRRFNCPTGLQSGDRVVLVVEGLVGELAVLLNGHLLSMSTMPGTTGTRSAEIQSHLQAHNEVRLELTVDRQPTTDEWLSQLRTNVLAAGLVRLEIYSPNCRTPDLAGN